MSYDTGISPYNWEQHFQLMDNLRHLDLYYLHLTGQRSLEPSSYQNRLITEFALAVGNKDSLSRNDYNSQLSAISGRIAGLADEHVLLSAARCQAIIRHAQEMIDVFQEDSQKNLVDQELCLRATQLYDLYDAMIASHAFYDADHNIAQDDTIWSGACEAIAEDICRFQDILHDRAMEWAACSDKPQADNISLSHFIHGQEALASISLQHAAIQAGLVEDCLRLVTLLLVRPDSSRDMLAEHMMTFLHLANPLMIMADFALDDAADSRQSAYLSRDTKLPIFKLSYP